MKGISSYALVIILLISVIFNIIQYRQVSLLKQNDSKFEELFGVKPSNIQSELNKQKVEKKYIKLSFSSKNTEAQILELKSILEKESGVTFVEYISAQQELNNFKAKHSNDSLTLQALEELGANPYGGSLVITLSDSSQKDSIAKIIESNKKYNIDSVNYDYSK